MRVMNLSRALVVYSLAAAILGSALYLATSDVGAIAAASTLSGTLAPANLVTGAGTPSKRSPRTALPALVNDAVSEWHQHAVNLTVLPSSALAPVQQTRVMAIIQVAVHDAVNGLTGEYATYLSPGPPPENASH